MQGKRTNKGFRNDLQSGRKVLVVVAMAPIAIVTGIFTPHFKTELKL